MYVTASAALTGAAAAHERPGIVTSIPLVWLRIDPDIALDDAATFLGLSPGREGANVRLVRDVGRVGTARPRVAGAVPLAPAVRVWLDLHFHRRGADAAALYYEELLQPALTRAGTVTPTAGR